MSVGPVSLYLAGPTFIKRRIMALNEGVSGVLAEMNKKLAKEGNPLLTVASDMFIPKKFTSGLVALDVALGGGWPGNQWVEVYGKESNGKTSIILNTIAVNQALDPNFMTFWVASEHYDLDWAAQNGVDNSRVVIIHTNNMELAYQCLMDAAMSHEFDCLVLDSYPALSASEEMEKTMEQNTMTLGARRTGQFFRKVGGTFSIDRPYIGFFVNQLRDAVGQFSPHGTPTTTPGGKAKNYAFYQRVLVSVDEYKDEKQEGFKDPVKYAQTNKYLLVKNKAAPPKAIARGDFYFAKSSKPFNPGEFDLVKDIVTTAVQFQIITRGGAWYSYKPEDGSDTLKWNGIPNMVEAIRDNMELREEIAKRTLETATQKD